MSTTQFIDELAAGNASGAKDILNDMLSARAFEALEGRKIEIAQNIFNGSVQEEEVEQVEEGTMTGITLGTKVKNKQGGYNQDVHHKGEKIGHIEAYKHRTGMRYGAHHHASGDATAGNRDAEESIADIRYSHAEHLRSMKKEEVEITQEEFDQLDELSKNTLRSYLKGSKAEAGSQLRGDVSDKAASLGRTQQDKDDSRYEGGKLAKRKLGAPGSIPPKVMAK